MSLKNMFRNFYLKMILVVLLIIALIAVSAEVDWWWSQGKLGLVVGNLTLVWLFGGLLGLGLLFALLLWQIGEVKPAESRPWKKLFFIALVLALVGHNLTAILYMMGFTIVSAPIVILTTIMMSLLPAVIPRPATTKRQLIYILLMVLVVVLPFMIGVTMFINLSWLMPLETLFTTLYWMFIWGFVMPTIYMTMALGYKMGGGRLRHAFNIALAGTLMQYSLLEDLFFYLLTGTPLPTIWPWLGNFIFPLELIFLHPGIAITTAELLIWLGVMTTISMVILFDIYGFVWDRYIKR